MVTRIRIEAQGASATEVEQQLRTYAGVIEQAFPLQATPGEQVITRDVNEPDGPWAFEGRMLLHPNVAFDSAQVQAFARAGVALTRDV